MLFDWFLVKVTGTPDSFRYRNGRNEEKGYGEEDNRSRGGLSKNCKVSISIENFVEEWDLGRTTCPGVIGFWDFTIFSGRTRM